MSSIGLGILAGSLSDKLFWMAMVFWMIAVLNMSVRGRTRWRQNPPSSSPTYRRRTKVEVPRRLASKKNAPPPEKSFYGPKRNGIWE